MDSFVRVKEGFGVIQDSRTERFHTLHFVKGASFEGWYDEKDIESEEITKKASLQTVSLDEEIELEEDTYVDEYTPFGTVDASELEAHMALDNDTDNQSWDDPADRVQPETDAPEVVFDEELEPAENEESRVAAWRDVQRKAKRLRNSGSVMLEYIDEDMAYGQVKGDHGVYTTSVYRGGRGIGERRLSTFSCSCKWGEWVYNRGKYYGRLCSHGAAILYEMQAMDSKKRRSSLVRTADEASDLALSWYQNSSDEELLNLDYAVFMRSLKSDGVDPDIIEDVWWELQEYIDRNIRRESTRSFESSYLSSIQKESVVGREAFYGGTVVVIRDVLSNNRVAVSYPYDDTWFVVMDEDLYSTEIGNSSPWAVEANTEDEESDESNSSDDSADTDDDSSSDDSAEEESVDEEDEEESKESSVDPHAYLLEGSDDDGAELARRAEAFLKEAGKAYTLEEQQELIDEDGISHEAISSLDLEGTHYLSDDMILP